MSLMSEAIKLRRLIEQMAVGLDDDTAEQNVNVFPNWEIGREYTQDDIDNNYRLRYKDVLYKIAQPHTSQADWTPDETPALYTRLHQQDPQDEWPEWVQPTGAHDAYAKGEKVSHNGKHWISNVEANVWEPSVYGWDEVE